MSRAGLGLGRRMRGRRLCDVSEGGLADCWVWDMFCIGLRGLISGWPLTSWYSGEMKLLVLG